MKSNPGHFIRSTSPGKVIYLVGFQKSIIIELEAHLYTKLDSHYIANILPGVEILREISKDSKAKRLLIVHEGRKRTRNRFPFKPQRQSSGVRRSVTTLWLYTEVNRRNLSTVAVL